MSQSANADEQPTGADVVGPVVVGPVVVGPVVVGPVVVGLGEALFDCFAHGAELGGAPVNASVHAAALLRRVGGVAAPATRVGDDDLGRRFFAELSGRGLVLDAVQVDRDRPTGRVLVEVGAGGNATYEFESDVAWDALEMTPSWESLAARCDALTFGTLAQRSEVSRRAIQRFVAAAPQAVRLLDVNLRGDFFSADVLEESLALGSAVKLNEEEAVTVTDLVGVRLSPDADLEQRAQRLREAYDLDWVAVTRGPDGAVIFNAAGRSEALDEVRLPEDAAADRDTVGAGDASCAALLVGALLGWAPPRTLQLANRIGAFVASRRGATPPLPAAVLDLVC
jgi:fructokinase